MCCAMLNQIDIKLNLMRSVPIQEAIIFFYPIALRTVSIQQ